MIASKHKELYKRILDISYKLKLSHIGSCLTALPIIEEIYSIKEPDEKFVLSAGHAHLAHLVVEEAYLGGGHAFEVEPLIEKYGIHCDRKAGCDFSTGSLGQGLPAAVGMALADRNKNVYCLVSDGECSEGSIWEALRIKDEQYIDNLIIYLNFNGWGAYKEIDNIYAFPLEYCEFRKTNLNDWPEWLQGQQAHYVVMSEQQYKEALQCLK